MKRQQKGFTIVELIIVIATIAVLASVLIPTFSNLIRQSQEAKDTALISDLNKGLAMSGTKFDTMHDALTAVDENIGIDVTKINAAATKNEILFDSENQCFVYLKEGETKPTYIANTKKTEIAANEQYKYWQIVKEPVSENKYSQYIAGTNYVDDVVVSAGVDVGSNTGIKNVKYENATSDSKNVVVRTNSFETTFTVNAASDTVYHFGTSQRVNVDDIANESYHELGNVLLVVLKSGHLVIEENSAVDAVVIDPASNATVLADINCLNDMTVYKTDSVTSTNTNIKVTNKVNEIVIDSGKIGDIEVGLSKFSGGVGTETNPFLIATSEDALNMKSQGGYFKIIDNIVVNNEIYLSGKEWTVDLNGCTVELEYGEGTKPNNGGVFNVSGKKSKLTIKDSSEKQTGTVLGDGRTYANKVTSAIRVGNYGKLEIYGGNFAGRSEGTSCIFVMTSRASGSKATVNIYGGTFKTESALGGTHYVLNHQDSASTGCLITVYGGTFINYNPGVTVVDPVNAYTGKINLADGCTTTAETKGKDTYYTVSK